MSAPPCADARGVADLRLWLAEQWRPGRTYHRIAAPAMAQRGHLYGERRSGSAGRYAEWELRTLETASLWWVGADMVDLLIAAAAGVPDEVVQYDLPWPSGSGLVIFEKPWWGVDSDRDQRIAVDALLWGATKWEPRVVRGAADQASFPPGAPGEPWYTGVGISSYRRLRFEEGLTGGELRVATATGAISYGRRAPMGRWREADHGTLAVDADSPAEAAELARYAEAASAANARTVPLTGARTGERAYNVTGEAWCPLGRSDWPVLHHLGDQPWNEDLPEQAMASYVEDRKVLAAFWTLIEQEGIASRREETADRPTRRRTERAGVEPKLANVQVIVLRRAKRADHDGDGGEHRKVNWSHRWYVEGFWRWQHVGPRGEGRRKLTYVRPHVRGPEDKPLHLPQRVHAWTR